MDNKIIDLKLPLNAVNLILDSLGQMPFFRVRDLIEEVRTQAVSQIEAPAETPAEE
jgi:hypothetical protein